MKIKFLSVIVLPAMLLSSCALFASTKTFARDIDVYDLDTLDDNGNLSSGYQTTLKTRYIGGREYIPYVTLQQYASLYESHFASGAKNSFQKVGYQISWVVTIGNQAYFQAIIDYAARTISFGGDLSATYASNDDPRDLKALNYGLDIDADGKYLSDNTVAQFSYYGYQISTFTYEGEFYFPLGLLDITFSNNSSIYFTYNYAHIMSTRDVDNYESLIYTDNGQEYTFDSQMMTNRKSSIIPSYLVDYNAYLFLYLMDNLYGLKDYYGISSMANYYKKAGIYSNLFSIIGSERGQAYLDALTILDDNHTALVSVNGTWDENQLYGRRYGTNVVNRSRLRSDLADRRERVYGTKKATKDILYSQDGKTAMIAFDSFAFGAEDKVFNPDGSIKDTAKDYDTYFMILDVLRTLKNAGTVENVVLDISINGGGVLGVMMKLLALISKNNSSDLSFYDDTTSLLTSYVSHVDSNDDGEYDASDSFGNDFNFYILTSDCSFSCGNAFPCIAQMLGDAKIIGQKSGGGECIVAIHYMPNSEYVYHSSNLHLGFYDETSNKFTGFEGGAKPDITLAINDDFYSIEAINNAIKNAN